MSIKWPRLSVDDHGIATLADEFSVPGRTFLFRGQSRARVLCPSLSRLLPPEAVTESVFLRLEQKALEHFQSQAHLHSDFMHWQWRGKEPSLFDWWALMQHHGAPTRLLDWTASPYVASYFAVEKDPEEPGVVFVIDADALDDRYRNVYRVAPEPTHFREPQGEGAIAAYAPFYKTPRVLAQQGYFTAATNPTVDHEELLSSSNAALEQWVISPDLKPHLLYELTRMNLSANSLFPGLDGLGRSTAEVVRLGSARHLRGG